MSIRQRIKDKLTGRDSRGTGPARRARRTAVLVGHCLPDRMMLTSAVRRAVGDASVEAVNDSAALEAHLNGESVLLVNRVLDGRFDTREGVELIRRVCAMPDPPLALLISNYPEAQQEAIDAGARLGFGKGQLRDESAMRTLQAALC